MSIISCLAMLILSILYLVSVINESKAFNEFKKSLLDKEIKLQGEIWALSNEVKELRERLEK